MKVLVCLLLPAAHAAGLATATNQQYLKFHNQSEDFISLSLEEACLPTYGAVEQRVIKPRGSALVAYDPTVANCVLIVPEKKELGVQTSLFVLEPMHGQYRPDAVVTNCRVEISKLDAKRRTYAVQSACIRVLDSGGVSD